MDFVFIAIDSGKARKLIAEKLEEFGVEFIDVGMGVKEKHSSLVGVVRTTTSTASHRSKKLPFSGGDEDDDYTRNIQVADLNALNAIRAGHRDRPWRCAAQVRGIVRRERWNRSPTQDLCGTRCEQRCRSGSRSARSSTTAELADFGLGQIDLVC
jgi:hypothetical protein